MKAYTEEYIRGFHGNPVWEAIWRAIKGWDVQRETGAGYAGATGTDVTHIFEAIRDADAAPAPAVPVQGRGKAAQGKAQIPPG